MNLLDTLQWLHLIYLFKSSPDLLTFDTYTFYRSRPTMAAVVTGTVPEQSQKKPKFSQFTELSSEKVLKDYKV